MAHSTITCVYTVQVVGAAFTPAQLAARINAAAVPPDLGTLQLYGLRISSDTTANGPPVVRTIVLKMGPSVSAAGTVQRYMDTPDSMLSGLTLTGAGRDYVAVPLLTISDPTGSGATAHMELGVVSTSVSAGGSGYSAATIATFVGGNLAPGGVPATGHVTIVGTSVTAVVIDSSGGPYVQGPPTVMITDTGGGSGAVAACSMGATSLVLDNPGQAYSNPTLVITPLFLSGYPDTAAQAATVQNWMTGVLAAAAGISVQASIPVVT